MAETIVPISYITQREKGSYGKFRYPVHHLTSFNGKPAVSGDLIPDGANVHEGVITIPEHTVSRIGAVAAWLSKGVDQTGLYNGVKIPTNNCARFVHDINGVDFDRRMLTDSSIYGAWLLDPQAEGHIPAVGEITVYTRPGGTWAHWAMGLGEASDLSGVLGLGGPNAHAISIADNWDVAKALGHTQPNTAHHSES